MVTVIDIANRLTDHTGEPRISAYATLPVNPPESLVNEAIYEALCYMIAKLQLRGYTIKNHFHTVASQSSYSVLAGVYFEDIIRMLYNGTSSVIEPTSWEEMQDMSLGTTGTTGYSTYYAPDLDTFGNVVLWPTPSDAKQVDFWYLNIPVLFTASSTTLVLSNREQSLLTKIAIPCFDYLLGKTSHSNALALMDVTLTEYKLNVKQQLVSGFPYQREL